jgi:hypothetical protein
MDRFRKTKEVKAMRRPRLAPAKASLLVGTLVLSATSFAQDFKTSKPEAMVIFMGRLHPAGGLTLDRQVGTLAYQAIIE